MKYMYTFLLFSSGFSTIIHRKNYNIEKNISDTKIKSSNYIYFHFLTSYYTYTHNVRHWKQ